MRYKIAAAAMLAIWAVATAFYQAPGWIHLLLSGGLALWIYGVVAPPTANKK